MKIKILIIDDEDIARQGIRLLLEKHTIDFEIEEADNGLSALKQIESFSPQILFLDIEMPGLSGFDLLLETENRDFKIIFQTAYENFALQAFEESACDYILKPYSEKRFYLALEKAIQEIDNNLQLDHLKTYLAKKGHYLEKLSLALGNSIKIIQTSTIHYFKSEQHITFACWQENNNICNHSLKYLEQQLDPNMFIRIYKNIIVNKTFVSSYKKGRPMFIVMKDGTEFKVSKERTSGVRKFLNSTDSPV